MRFTTLLLAVTSALLVSAQSESSSSSSTIVVTATSTTVAPGAVTCDAQAVLDACKATEQAQINGCAPNDYSCLCQQYGNLLTCYNNCPADPGLFGVQQEQTQNCNAAKAYGTTTLMVATYTPTSTTSTAAETGTGSAATGFVSGGSSSSTSSGAASGASHTQNAAASNFKAEAAGGVLAVIAAAFGLFL